MKLPNAESAIVEDDKVRDYLLSPDHPIGRFKARVFNAVGYRHETWQRLRDDLIALAVAIEVELVHTNQHGQRWVGAGQLRGPAGLPLPVVTVWLIPSEGSPPRLITAYPASAP